MDAEQQRAEFLKRLGEEATMHEKGGSLKDQRHVQARTMIDLGTHLEIISFDEGEQLGTALARSRLSVAVRRLTESSATFEGRERRSF